MVLSPTPYDLQYLAMHNTARTVVRYDLSRSSKINDLHVIFSCEWLRAT